ncbi:BCCT family transporter [Rhodovibrio salinarum]|uniref:BCCT family transporter n=1 Tax=Rhodovibrio salinarum TaxID=1087 RepID=A0A934V0K0_9PROT|nr:BCCT family transporter [Rhodovibrio salinarum]MBK1697978.1 BCCT family transporter [Rhodovibrio salinarum]
MANLNSYLKEHTNPPVFLISAAMVVAFVLWGVLAPGNLGDIASSMKSGISTYFGWWYIGSVTGFLVFVICLLFSPYARIKIGKDHEEPEWSTWGWFSMLFTAGMGIGLVFYGVAEPIFHFNKPPVGEPGTAEAAVTAMNLTFFHWGLHPWAVYIVVGLSMGYFCFRHDLPLRPASAFYPLIGEAVYGWLGNLIDILAVFGTLFGLATSLGLGATQINAGLNSVFGLPISASWQVIIIGVVTAVAVTSVMAGLDAGVRRLSVINMYLAILLALVVFVVGPTLFILKFVIGATGHYIQHLPETSLRMFTFSQEGSNWISTWTLFYWGWWIAWSPFVGMFIARISRGRTIRQFILGCLLAPTGASIVWFTIFGGSALDMLLNGGNQLLSEAGTNDAMFVLIEQLSLPSAFVTLFSLLAIVVVAVFFATSSDSGSLVVDMLTNGGDPHPIWQQRLFWAVTEGGVAAILLVAGAATEGDPLKALQTASVTSGLPFSIVLAFMCWGLIRQLRSETIPPRQQSGYKTPAERHRAAE